MLFCSGVVFRSSMLVQRSQQGNGLYESSSADRKLVSDHTDIGPDLEARCLSRSVTVQTPAGLKNASWAGSLSDPDMAGGPALQYTVYSTVTVSGGVFVLIRPPRYESLRKAPQHSLAVVPLSLKHTTTASQSRPHQKTTTRKRGDNCTSKISTRR